MNVGKRDEAAILGTLSKTSYISFGTKDNPLPYSAKMQDRDNFKGKQFKASTLPTGKHPNLFYEKQHPWIGKGLPYTDRVLYKETQPQKPGKGFGTSDYQKRDEFSNTIRTTQYREQLKSEGKFAKKALQTAPAKSCGTNLSEASTTINQRPHEKAFLYDLVHETPPSAAEDQAASRRRHDTKNPTLLSRDRFHGPYQTTNMAFHGASAAQFRHTAPAARLGVTA